ncbi:MAG: gliding motility-associated C-terminal domain-containing protein [Saprospiraceae bacterium]|nr:gliding motility-associated C-terminal domain-containing protein [Saprospiraceae bacterium]
MKNLPLLILINCLLLISSLKNLYSQGCELDVNAGPDLFTCDPTEILQLQGSINANYAPMLVEWSPTAGLSDPTVLDPIVSLAPGRYKFKLKAESVSDNLIINGDFEAGNAGFTNSMTYVSVPTGNLNPGEYTVTDDPKSYEASWRCGVNGNVLLGECSASAGLNVWCQTVPTKPGGTYFFRFIATKMNKFGAPMHFKAEANGILLGESPYVPVCGWVEFRTCFVATSSTTTLCIKDSRGSRSTFAIDDIELIQKCKDEDEVEVEIVDLKAKLRTFPAPTCNSQEYTVDALVSTMPKSPNIKFIWTATNGGTILQNYGGVIKAKGAGTYKVKIIYTSNLGTCEDETEIDVETADQLEGQLDVQGKPTCNKDTFDLIGFVTQGTGSYTYTWSPASNIISGQGTPFARATNPGKYTLKIVDKNTGCDFTTTVKVDGDGTLPSGLITGDTMIDCNKPFVTLDGLPTDTSVFSLTWITPDQKQIKDITKIDINIPGEVKLVVVDKASKCADTAYWNIYENVDYPKIELGQDLIIDCKIEEHNILPIQDLQLGKFKYYWTLPGGNSVVEDGLFEKKINQSGKVYIRVVNEDNNCATTDSIDILDLRSSPSIKINNPAPINCSILNVRINSVINAKNAIINWTTIVGNILNGSNSSSIQVDKGGKYFIEVEDTIGHCIITDSILIIEDKKTPIVDLKVDTVFKCKDTQKEIDGSGSSSYDHLKFIWTGNGVISSGQGTNKLIVNSAGTFRLTIIDTTNGCQDNKQITINPDQNTPVASIANPAILNCKITSIQLSATASTTSGNNLSFSWVSTQGNPIVDGNTLSPKVSLPGTYILTVEDLLNGCSTTQSIKVDIDTVSPYIDLGSDLQWKCNTTELDLDIKNNTQGLNYSYAWTSNNGGIILGNVNTKNIKAGAAGTYQLVVTDNSNFCTSLKEIRITEDKAIPLAVSSTGDILTCVKKAALLNSLGSSSGSNFSTIWKDINGNIIGNGSTVSVNSIGKYILQVTDLSNSCIQSDTVEVIQDIKNPDIDAGTGQLLTCKLTQLNLSGTVIGNPSFFIVNWTTINGSIVNGSNTFNPSINKEGDYLMTVTDINNGCISTDIVSIVKDQNVPVKINFTVDQPKCVENPGLLNLISITGGKPNYTYYLNGNIIDINSPIDVSVGTHSIRVVDDNGCEITDQLTVIKASPIEITTTPDVNLYVGDNYEIRPNYSIPLIDIVKFEWTPANSLDCSDCPYPKINKAAKDETYTVNITDINGCTATATVRVRVEERGIWVPNVFSPNGDGVNDEFYPIVKPDSYKAVRWMNIYDRWGELVWTNQNFEPNTPANGWKGLFREANINPGVYVWVLEIEWKNGEIEKLFGDVTLMK